MRTVTDVSLTAPGSSPWIPLNYLSKWFGATAFASLDSGSTGSYSLQRTYDDFTIVTARNVVVTRVAALATVVDVAHGLSAGDSITMQGIGDGNMDGQHDITFVDANTYTYAVANSGPTIAPPGAAKVNSFRVIPDANMTAKTARADCPIVTPVTGVRLVATAVSGTIRLRVIQGHGG